MKRTNYTIITCADCGGPAKATNKRTMYCDLCRLARQVQWHDLRPSTCPLCSRSYIEWAGPGKTKMCGRCFIAARPGGTKDSVVAACAVAGCNGGQEQRVFHEDLHICYTHLDDPAYAKSMKSAVPSKQRERMLRFAVVS